MMMGVCLHLTMESQRGEEPLYFGTMTLTICARRTALTNLVLAVFCCLLPHRSVASGPEPGTPALMFQGRDGRSHSFDELRGRPAVVNFWATWCGPCRAEMPRLQQLSEAYAGQGVRFVAISLDEEGSGAKIDAITEKRRFHVPVWTGATEGTLTQLKLGVLVPATLILDEHSEIIGRIEGEAREKDIRARLDWVLGGREGKQPKTLQKNDW